MKESPKYLIKVRVKVCVAITYQLSINLEENCSNSRKTHHRLYKLNDDNREVRVLANVKRHDPIPKENHFFLFSNHFEKSCFERDFKLRFHLI